MKRILLSLLVITILVACGGSPTPDEHTTLKAYLGEAKTLIDKRKATNDAIWKESGLDAIYKEKAPEDYSTPPEERKAWQKLAILEYASYLEFQSQWEALNPPPLAHVYHAQMALVIEKKLEEYVILQSAPIANDDAFGEALMRSDDVMVEAIFLEAEAGRKFDILWEMATEEEQ